MFDFLKKNDSASLMEVTADTVIGDILDAAQDKGVAPQAAQLFMSIGMHCLGCPASRGETVEEACQVHGLGQAEMEQLIAALNGLVK